MSAANNPILDLVRQEPSQFTRRSFLKSAGAVAGAAGVLAASGRAWAADGPMKDYLPDALLRSAIKRHDSFPYDVSGLSRYDEAKHPLSRPPGLAKFLAGLNQEAVALAKQEAKEPGNTLLDFALYDSAWTGTRAFNFYNWETLKVAKTDRLARLGKWTGTPEQANIVVKKAARVLGAGDVGVCRNNELWWYEKDAKGVPYVFTDAVDRPTHTPEAHLIPKTMRSVVVCVVPIDLQMLQFVPAALGEGAVGLAYSRMAELAGSLAEFLRQLGYNAIPMGNDTSLSVPFAIDAGLGEQGRHNMCIHPIFGSAMRPIKVLTDLDIAPDPRITFGVREFCRTCKKCARLCPAGAISMDDADHCDPLCPSNNPGGKDKWYIDSWKCYKFWNECGTGCGICIRTCTYSKPNHWPHSLVESVSSRTAAFNPLFIKLDEIMGYGSFYDPEDAAAFWQTADWVTRG